MGIEGVDKGSPLRAHILHKSLTPSMARSKARRSVVRGGLAPSRRPGLGASVYLAVGFRVWGLGFRVRA